MSAFTYGQLEIETLLESLHTNGVVEISMTARRARLSQKLIRNADYFKSLEPGSRPSRIKVAWMFLQGLWLQARVSLFHPRLAVIAPFYVVSAPVEIVLVESVEGDVTLRFRRSQEVSQ